MDDKNRAKPERDVIVAAARAAYEADPITVKAISFDFDTGGDEYAVPFDELEASGTEIYNDLLATAEARLTAARDVSEAEPALGGIEDRGHI